MKNLLYEGSVKNIYGQEGDDTYLFEFSNRYSVFDWGGMPDELAHKGECLSYMANLFFEKLGCLHHGIGTVDEKQNLTDKLTPFYKVKAVQVHKPEFNEGVWNYDSYKDSPKDCLVPLEVIFRFGVPNGSSLLKRVGNEGYLNELGLAVAPKVGDTFEEPIIEYSTKLETTDRYISLDDASLIAGLTKNESLKLKKLCISLSKKLKTIFNDIEIQLWDGKFEFSFSKEVDSNGDRDFVLVDSVGPDELRLTYKDVQLSKETLRGFYRDSPWYHSVEKAKKLAEVRGLKDWKEICTNELGMSPPPLKAEVLESVSMLYQTLANELGKTLKNETPFPNAWSLDKLIKELK